MAVLASYHKRTSPGAHRYGPTEWEAKREQPVLRNVCGQAARSEKA